MKKLIPIETDYSEFKNACAVLVLAWCLYPKIFDSLNITIAKNTLLYSVLTMLQEVLSRQYLHQKIRIKNDYTYFNHQFFKYSWNEISAQIGLSDTQVVDVGVTKIVNFKKSSNLVESFHQIAQNEHIFDNVSRVALKILFFKKKKEEFSHYFGIGFPRLEEINYIEIKNINESIKEGPVFNELYDPNLKKIFIYNNTEYNSWVKTLNTRVQILEDCYGVKARAMQIIYFKLSQKQVNESNVGALKKSPFIEKLNILARFFRKGFSFLPSLLLRKGK
ncbi:hypothetical protein ACFLZV_03885 [Candidatus Margulisiibacteriota bacterium]